MISASILTHDQFVSEGHGYVSADDLLLVVSRLQKDLIPISTIELLHGEQALHLIEGGVLSYPFEADDDLMTIRKSFDYYRRELDDALKTKRISAAEIWLYQDLESIKR
tara:strand:- start:433 stop:759 length:327 start_codon:yes stop_codon:yes gene_type:complete